MQPAGGTDQNYQIGQVDRSSEDRRADGSAAPAAQPGEGAPTGRDRRPMPEAEVDAVDELLDDVEDALLRIDEGTYGQCRSCGKPIGDARLGADPTAHECEGCAPSRVD